MTSSLGRFRQLKRPMGALQSPRQVKVLRPAVGVVSAADAATNSAKASNTESDGSESDIYYTDTDEETVRIPPRWNLHRRLAARAAQRDGRVTSEPDRRALLGVLNNPSGEHGALEEPEVYDVVITWAKLAEFLRRFPYIAGQENKLPSEEECRFD